VREFAQERNVPVAAISLAWLRTNPQVSTPIASARTVEQLEEIVQIVELNDVEVASLNSLSA
jgi:aryl-alcohol dehydrogenase-like predicted oxidoreductase